MNVSKTLLIGLALFCMFFGSGNLIFPLAVGRLGLGDYGLGALGFILTGVLLPFLGVVTMMLFDGDSKKFFGILGKKVGFWMTLILLFFWIPFGAGSRCVSVTYASFKPYLGEAPMWVFSLVYCGILFLSTIKKNKIVEVLGFYLTPILLACLGVFVARGFYVGGELMPSTVSVQDIFVSGFLEGYYTMDLIASFFFSSTIITLIKSDSKDGKKSYFLEVVVGSLLGMFILAVVYIGLMHVAAMNTASFVEAGKDELLPRLSLLFFGEELAFISAVIVGLACLTTSIAITVVFSEFFQKEIFKGRVSYKSCLVGTILLTGTVSTVGFSQVNRIVEPAFQLLYPILIFMILYSFSVEFFTRSSSANESDDLKVVQER